MTDSGHYHATIVDLEAETFWVETFSSSAERDAFILGGKAMEVIKHAGKGTIEMGDLSAEWCSIGFRWMRQTYAYNMELLKRGLADAKIPRE